MNRHIAKEVISYAHTAIRKVHSIDILRKPFPGRRCNVNKTERSTVKSDRINEFSDKEIESIVIIPGEFSIDHVAQVLYSAFAKNTYTYTIAASLPQISESKTKHLRYERPKKPGNNARLFVINSRNRDGFITLKRKGQKAKQDSVEIRDEYEEPLAYDRWTEQSENDLKLRESELAGILPEDIFLSRVTEKRKLKVRVINKETDRVYTVGVNEKITDSGITEKSIGIEYIGIEPNQNISHSFNPDLNIIIMDILSIRNLAKKACDNKGIQFV